MHPNDIAPYRDRFLVVQYTTDHRSRQGYRYEVGLLDLGREPGIQELGVRTIHQRASPLSPTSALPSPVLGGGRRAQRVGRGLRLCGDTHFSLTPGSQTPDFP
jgi:hypothetical protein